MKRAGADTPPLRTTNPRPPLYTIPVGPPSTTTVSDCFLPSAAYSVLRPRASLAVHHGPVGLAARPHALTSAASCVRAESPASDTSARTTYAFAPRAASTATSAATTAATAAANTRIALRRG